MKKLLIICLLLSSIVADEFSLADDKFKSTAEKEVDNKTLYPLVGAEIDEFMSSLEPLDSKGTGEFMPSLKPMDQKVLNAFMPILYPEGYVAKKPKVEPRDELLDLEIKKPKKDIFASKDEIKKVEKIKTKIKKDENDIEFFDSLDGVEQKPVNMEK